MRSKPCHIARLPLYHDSWILVDFPDIVSVVTGDERVRIVYAIERDYGWFVWVVRLQVPRSIWGRLYLRIVRRVPE